MLRALTILAVLLTVAQAMVPASGQTSDHHADRSQPVTRDSQSDKQQPPPALTRIQPVSTQPNEQPGKTIAKDDAQKTIRISEFPSVSITRDWIDRLAILFTGVLVGVGFFGVRAANETLRAIREQGSVMKQQADVMATQAEHMARQTGLLADSISVAEKSADVAQKSVDAVIGKERARIRVEVDNLYTRSFELANVAYFVHCYGSTEAFISESSVMAIVTESSDRPDSLPIFPMKLPAVLKDPKTDDWVFISNRSEFSREDFALLDAGKIFVHFYGIVKYKDVFDHERETAFCHVYKATSYRDPKDGSVVRMWLPNGGTKANWET
jgi:hypothetical protein